MNASALSSRKKKDHYHYYKKRWPSESQRTAPQKRINGAPEVFLDPNTFFQRWDYGACRDLLYKRRHTGNLPRLRRRLGLAESSYHQNCRQDHRRRYAPRHRSAA